MEVILTRTERNMPNSVRESKAYKTLVSTFYTARNWAKTRMEGYAVQGECADINPPDEIVLISSITLHWTPPPWP